MQRQLFNDGWIFCLGTGTSMDQTLGIGATAVEEEVRLPHDAMIYSERVDSGTGASLGFYTGQNYHYTKVFTLDASDSDKSVWIDFEGVYQDAFVYVNGSFAGRCNYGYGSYYLDLTDFVNFGAENKIIVVVKNEGRSGRWYTGGGIYRDVHLMLGNPLHIACDGTRVTVEDLEPDEARIRTETPIEYRGSRPVVCRVVTRLLDRDGNIAAEDSSPITILGHEKTTMRQKFYVQNPNLWDLNHPYLYKAVTRIYIEDEIQDTYETSFGIRKFQLDVHKGLRLNGKEIKLRGGCVHLDSGIIGTATYDRAEWRRVRKMKEAGFNAIRSGAHPLNRAMLEACDALGMLVVEEFTDVFNNIKVDFDYGSRFDLFWREDLSNMILREYNHPCLFMYSLGCENPQVGDRIDKRLVKQMCDLIHSMDPLRYISIDVSLTLIMFQHVNEVIEDAQVNENTEVNSAMNNQQEFLNMLYESRVSDQLIEEACAQLDVVGYNYITNRYDRDHKNFPNRILMASECTPRDLAVNKPYIDNCPFVLGDFCWSAWDYLGEAGVGRSTYDEKPEDMFYVFYGKWPWRLADCGTIDILGNRKTISYWREIVWGLRTAPYIAVRDPKHYGEPCACTMWGWISTAYDSWTWPGYESKPIQVEVLTAAKEVELFVNGRSVGTQKTGEELLDCAVFDLAYEPGEIKAVDSNGQEFMIRTAGDMNHIRLSAEETQIQAGGHDIAFVEIRICDSEGIVNGYADLSCHVRVEGAGKLLGLGSADPRSEEPYHGTQFRAFHGKLMAVIRSEDAAGEIRVTVSAEGCEDAVIVLEAV